MDIVNRAKTMIASPRTEWEVTAAEPTDTQQLFLNYVAPLAAIPPLARFIGNSLLFGRSGIGAGILGAIITYVLSLIGVYVIGWIAAKLARSFGGRGEVDQGVKLIAYAWTASWLGGVFHLVPAIGLLGAIASFYSLYILFIGIGPMLGVPQGRVVAHFIALFVALIVVYIVIGLVVVGIVGAGATMGGAV
ncbi:MAG: Yip1 family protein [Stellaceae bacterium]